MSQTKSFLCICAVLVALGSAALTPRRASVKVLKIDDLVPCEDSSPVDISPKFRMNSRPRETEDLKVIASTQCMQDPAAENTFYTQITLTAPIFNSTIPPPSDPSEEIANTSDDEHVRVYFTNANKRMLELQFNRFEQKSARLLKKPYNELNKDLPQDSYHLTVTVDPETNEEWIAVVTFPPEYLPANVTSVNVVVIDPTQQVEASRYIMNYRLYNNPISIPDMQVPSSFTVVDPQNIVPVELNTEYSDLWNGIE